MVSPMESAIDRYEFPPPWPYSSYDGTKLERILLNLIEVIAEQVPESKRYGIDMVDLEDFFYEEVCILNQNGDGLHEDFLSKMRSFFGLDYDLSVISAKLQEFVGSKVDLEYAFSKSCDEKEWDTYSHVEDRGKQGRHFLHIETIGISFVVYLKPTGVVDVDDEPTYTIRHIEVKNTSELPEWAQPKKDES